MADETGDLFAAHIDAGQSMFASQSLAEIEAHLAGLDRSDCRCSDSTHENAVHDLIHIDMPVLIAEVKRLRARLAAPRRIESGAEADSLSVGSVLLDAKGRAWQKCMSHGATYWAVAAASTVEYSGTALLTRHGDVTFVCDPTESVTPKENVDA